MMKIPAKRTNFDLRNVELIDFLFYFCFSFALEREKKIE